MNIMDISEITLKILKNVVFKGGVEGFWLKRGGNSGKGHFPEKSKKGGEVAKGSLALTRGGFGPPCELCLIFTLSLSLTLITLTLILTRRCLKV